MYKAYKINVDSCFEKMLRQTSTKFSKKLIDIHRIISSIKLKKKLSAMIENSSIGEGDLSADSIWGDWFPEVQADVFISHSSKDADLAKSFAVWLKSNFNLTSFIDSEIWGHSDALLKKIDDEFCPHPNGTSYSYELRNGSTAHVHMMLSYALTRMIDKTECFVFLESDNSVTANDSISGTYSPWIFHELATVDTIEPKIERQMVKVANYSQKHFSEGKALKVKYPIWGKRLTEVDINFIFKWHNSYKKMGCEHALDVLYNLTKTGD